MASAPYLKRATNGVLYVHWTEDRKGKRISTGTKEMAEATGFFANWLLMERNSVPNAAVTVGDCWRLYEAKHVLVEIRNPKKALYCWSKLEPHFGDTIVAAVSQDMIDAYVAARTKGKMGPAVQPPTVRSELVFLLAAIKFCTLRANKLIEPAEADGILRGLKLPPLSEPRDRWLRTEEIAALHRAAREMRSASSTRMTRGERFLWLALETAARKEAIMDLTWDRVDFETGTIDYNVPGRKKTKKRRAVVPISTALRPALEAAYAERINDVVMDHGGDIWWTIQSIAIRAGLSPKQNRGADGRPKATGISPHVFRHTAATHMARNGVPLWNISRILGNSLDVVEQTYAKWQPGAAKAAVDAIGGVYRAAAE